MILVQLINWFQKVSAVSIKMLSWLGGNKKVKTRGRVNGGSANKSFKRTAGRGRLTPALCKIDQLWSDYP
jgi:hypothetical protein